MRTLILDGDCNVMTKMIAELMTAAFATDPGAIYDCGV